MQKGHAPNPENSLQQQGAPPKADDGGFEVLKLQLDYVWKWFQYHATQRVMMFNYFLIITGIVATAYVSLLKEGNHMLAGAVGVFGLFTSVGFIFLDCRNRELVHLAERIMEKIECDTLFAGMKANTGSTDVQLGILYREWLDDEAQKERLAALSQTANDKIQTNAPELRALKFRMWKRRTVFRHTFWFRNTEKAVACLFVLLSIRAFGAALGLFSVHTETTDLQNKVDTMAGMVRDMNTTNLALQQQLGYMKAQSQHDAIDRAQLQQRLEAVQKWLATHQPRKP